MDQEAEEISGETLNNRSQQYTGKKSNIITFFNQSYLKCIFIGLIMVWYKKKSHTCIYWKGGAKQFDNWENMQKLSEIWENVTTREGIMPIPYETVWSSSWNVGHVIPKLLE